MVKSTQSFFHLLSVVFFSVAVSALLGASWLIRDRYIPTSFSELEVISPELIEDDTELIRPTPVQLWLDPKDTKVPLISGGYSEGKWKLSTDAALAIQGLSERTDPIVIYGHNYERLLGNLHLMHKGDNLQLILSDWSTREYEVETISEVSPHDVAVLLNEDADLIVYTCTGFLDSKRLVVSAKLLTST